MKTFLSFCILFILSQAIGLNYDLATAQRPEIANAHREFFAMAIPLFSGVCMWVLFWFYFSGRPVNPHVALKKGQAVEIGQIVHSNHNETFATVMVYPFKASMPRLIVFDKSERPVDEITSGYRYFWTGSKLVSVKK